MGSGEAVDGAAMVSGGINTSRAQRPRCYRASDCLAIIMSRLIYAHLVPRRASRQAYVAGLNTFTVPSTKAEINPVSPPRFG